MNVQIKKMTLDQEIKTRIKIMKEIVARMMRQQPITSCLAI